MKKMTIMASAIMMAAAAHVNAENLEIKPFNEVKVSVPANVRFVYGEKYSMNVRSSNSIAEKALSWQVTNGVLSISSQDELEIENLRITIISPTLPELKAGNNVEIKENKKAETTSREIAMTD